MIKGEVSRAPATCRRDAQHVSRRRERAHESMPRHTPIQRGVCARAAFGCAFSAAGPALRGGASLIVLASSLAALCAQPARASDFWDEVRSPGLGAQRMHLRRGRDALAANRADLALAEGDAAIARCAACPEGAVLRGRSLHALARHTEAVVAFEQALALRAQALDDAVPDALAAAFSACATGKTELATRVLERLLTRKLDRPARSRAIAMLADALQATGPSELRRAIVTYREAMIDDDARKHALLGLALALDRNGEHEAALDLARRAGPEAEPSTSDTWLPESERTARLGLWLMAIGDPSAADQALARAADAGGPWSAYAAGARKAVRQKPSSR
jgi:tetratricopeptide (TPR) repeat protein